MNVTITVDAKDALSYLQRISDQVPFATSKALNAVANHGQAAIRNHIRQAFTLRRPEWVLNTIKIEKADRATKAKLNVTIRIDPSRDVLAKFEEGGLKRPREGSRVAIPLAVRRNRNDIIARAQRPRALLASRRGQSGRIFATATGILQAVGRLTAGVTRTLYLLKPTVMIPRKLSFVPSATRSVESTWVAEMTAAFAEAERTARR